MIPLIPFLELHKLSFHLFELNKLRSQSDELQLIFIHFEVSQIMSLDPTLKIHRSIVTKILAQSERWSSVLKIKGSKEIYKNKRVKFPELDRAMSLWIESVIAGGVILTDSLIKEKVRFFANAFNIQEDKLVLS